MVGYSAKQFFEMTEEELRAAIPPEDIAKVERARMARIKGLTCVRCSEVLNSDNYLILDTETTGLGRYAEIIELAIIDTKGQVLYESLFKPTQPIPTEATEIHGITDEMVKDCPDFGSEWEQIWEVIKNKTLLIYNADFDTSMLYRTLERHGITLEDGFRFDSFCIMEFYQAFKDYRYWTKLEHACDEMGIEIEQNHRAADDCRMVLELIKAIAKVSN